MPPAEITFTYSVTWEQSNVPYSQRGKLLRGTGFFPKSLEVNCFSTGHERGAETSSAQTN